MRSRSASLYRAGLVLLAPLLGCTAGGGLTEDTVQTSAEVSLSITVANAIGRVVSDGNGLTRSYHSYDDLDREAASQHVLDGSSYVYSTAFGYPQDAITVSGLGSVVTSVTFPDSEVVAYTYDAGGAAQSVTATPPGGTQQTIVSKQLRNARGQTTEVDYGDGLKQVHCYDDTTDLRLNAIKTGTWSGTPSCTTAATTLVQSYGYVFDADAHVTTVDDYCTAAVPGVCCDPAGGSCSAQAMSATYGYDPLGELTTATSNGTTNYYGYDNVGNLTCMQGTASGCGNQTYPTQGAASVRPHAVSSSTASGSSVTFAYDADGNMTSTSAGLAITWSPDNMATQVLSGSTTINQKWFEGQHLWKKVEGSTTTHYLPSLRNEGGGYRKYYSGFAERDWTDTSSCTVNASMGCLKFYHSDHLGSSAVATTSTGGVVSRHSYWPYGGDRSLLGTFTPKYQFNFKEKDASGFYDYGARMYNDVTGRFISGDSVISEARYAYAANSPLLYTDPTGHDPDMWGRILLGPGYDVLNALAHPVRTFNQVGEAGLAVALAATGNLNWHSDYDRHAFYNALGMYATQGVLSAALVPAMPNVPKTIPAPGYARLIVLPEKLEPSLAAAAQKLALKQPAGKVVVVGHGPLKPEVSAEVAGMIPEGSPCLMLVCFGDKSSGAIMERTGAPVTAVEGGRLTYAYPLSSEADGIFFIRPEWVARGAHWVTRFPPETVTVTAQAPAIETTSAPIEGKLTE
jgi:RHS repeat-associated protein